MAEQNISISNLTLYINLPLQLLSVFSEFSPSMFANFIGDMPRLLKITYQLSELAVCLSMDCKNVEVLITKCVVWRMLYLITVFKCEDEE